MKISEVLRLYHVKRWSIVPTAIPQSVAEHSWGVAQITMELMKTGYTVAEFHAGVVYALNHDLAEVYSGDIPSNFKQKLVANGTQLNKKIDELYPEAMVSVPPEIKAIVKVADTIEAIHFLRNFGVGSMQEQVLADMGDRLIALAEALPGVLGTKVANLVEELTSPRYRM